MTDSTFKYEMMKIHTDEFVRYFNAMTAHVHGTAKDKGFWEVDAGDGEKIALIHSEVSEALEGLRHGNGPDDKIPEFSAAEAELADAIIRIMDLGEKRGWRIGEAIVAKAAYNEGRPYKHGKQF